MRPMGRTRLIAYSATFAVLYAIGRIIPFSEFIGAPGFVPFSNSLVLLYALLLGPVAGPLSAVLGTFISFSLGRAPIFLGLDFLTPMSGTLVAALVVRRRYLTVVGASFLALLVLFNVSPLTLSLVEVPYLGLVPWAWLHLVALAILVLYAFFMRNPVSARDTLPQLIVKTGAASFVGLLFQQLVGDLLFEGVFGLYGGEGIEWFAATWRLDFIVYPWEWTSLAVISVALAIPIYKIVSRRLPSFSI